jgi:hypothetical protein
MPRADPMIRSPSRAVSTDVPVNGGDFFCERWNLQVVAEPTLLCEGAHLDFMNDFRICGHGREDCVHV